MLIAHAVALHFKRRTFRLYLQSRKGVEKFEVRVFAAVFRMVTGIHVLPVEVECGSYGTNGRPPIPKVISATITSRTIKVAESMFETSRTRITSVSGKLGTLLTVTGIAVSGTIASLSLLGIPAGLSFFITFFASIAVFVCAGWFMFKFLAVGQSAALLVDENFLSLSTEGEKAELVRSLLTASANNDRRTDFLVDVYKAARILCALTCLCGLVLVTFAVRNRMLNDDRLITKLRSDPALIELLRGPKGEKGTQGNQGQNGSNGKDGTSFIHWVDLPEFRTSTVTTKEETLWLSRAKTAVFAPTSSESTKDH